MLTSCDGPYCVCSQSSRTFATQYQYGPSPWFGCRPAVTNLSCFASNTKFKQPASEYWSVIKSGFTCGGDEVAGHILEVHFRTWVTVETWRRIDGHKEFKFLLIAVSRNERAPLELHYSKKAWEVQPSVCHGKMTSIVALLSEAGAGTNSNDFATIIYKASRKSFQVIVNKRSTVSVPHEIFEISVRRVPIKSFLSTTRLWEKNTNRIPWTTSH